MKPKKTEKASLKGRNIFYFLIGLNLVLLGVWMLFGIQTMASDFKEVVSVEKINYDPSKMYVVEKEIPEEKLPEPEEIPLPEPDIDLTDLVEVDEPLDKQPDLTPIDEPKITDITTTPVNPPRNVIKNFEKLKNDAENVKEVVLEPVSANVVTTMAIYPGCEKFEGDKRALVNCFSSELGKDILQYLNTEFPDTKKDKVAVQLEFNVNTKGEIVDIVPARGDEEFKLQAKEALEKVAKKLKRKGKLIVPAKMKDDSKAILKFQRGVVLEKP